MNKNTARLKSVMAAAKKLYKTGRYKKWTDAVAASWKKQPGKKVGAVKIIQKGEKKSTPAKKVLIQKRTKSGTFKGYAVVSGNSIGEGKMYQIRDLYEMDLKRYVTALHYSKLKKDKKAITFYSGRIKKIKEALRKQNSLINSMLK